MFYRMLSLVFINVIALSSTLYAGAGVLPIFKDGTVLVGIEIRNGQKVASDFGGGQDRKDGGDNCRTATREGNEETAGTFRFKYHQVTKAPSVFHKHRVGSYQMYFVQIHGRKPSIQEIMKNKHAIERKLGRQRAHVEKISYTYVDAKALVNAAFGNGLLPGTNIPLFGPFKACLKKDASNSRGALNTLIHSRTKAAPSKQPHFSRKCPSSKARQTSRGRSHFRHRHSHRQRHASRHRNTSRHRRSR